MTERNQPTRQSPVLVKLPVDDYRDEIIEKCDKNEVVIVSGDTGSGKSSRISQFLMHTEHYRSVAAAASAKKNNKKAKNKFSMVTQPRRIAALSLCKRVAEEQGDVVRGSDTPTYKRVGYAIGQDRKFDTHTADLVFVTCGWLLNKAVNSPNFVPDHLAYLVIDEAHERDVDMDLLCFIAKNLLKDFAGRLKLVIMSATLDIDLFRTYFGTSTATVTINMRRFPVKIYHIDEIGGWPAIGMDAGVAAFAGAMKKSACKEDPKGTCGAVVHLCEKNIFDSVLKSTTVLVFCSGVREIEDIYEKFQRIDPKGERFYVYALHSLMEKADQMQVFSEPDERERTSKILRVVLATNIAESSVTIPSAEFVIDLGKHKMMRYDEDEQVMQLSCVDISRASAKQRAGRTGRVCPGTVIRLYTAAKYEYEMDEHNPAEVQMVPLENTLLRLYALKKNASGSLKALKDPISCIAQLVDPTNEYQVQEAHTRLLTMGALKRDENAYPSSSDEGSEYDSGAESYEEGEEEEGGGGTGDNNDEEALLEAIYGDEMREDSQKTEDKLSTLRQDIDHLVAKMLPIQEQLASIEMEIDSVPSVSYDTDTLSFAEIMRQERMHAEQTKKRDKVVCALRQRKSECLERLRIIEDEIATKTCRCESYEREISQEKMRSEFQRVQDQRLKKQKESRSGRNVDITPFGSMLTQMPLSFDQCTFVLFGAQFHRYAAHFAVMAAYASARDVFLIPNHQDKDVARYQRTVRTTSAGRRYFVAQQRSELLGAVVMMRELLSLPEKSHQYRAWTSRHGLHDKRVRDFRSTAIEIISRLAECGFAVAGVAKNILKDRRSRNGIPLHIIDHVLPLSPNDSVMCSLLVSLALRKNLLMSPNDDCDDDDDSTNIETHCAIQPFSEIKGSVPDFLHSVLNEEIAPLCTRDALADVNVFVDASVIHATVKFENAESAMHVLRQLTYKGTANLQVTVGGGQQNKKPNRYSRNKHWRPAQVEKKFTVAVRTTETPDLREWSMANTAGDNIFERRPAVFDYPPRSPFHSLLKSSKTGYLSEISSDGHALCRHPLSAVGSASPMLAVTPALTKMGRARYRAPLLSIVLPEYQLLFALVVMFESDPNSSWGSALEHVPKKTKNDMETDGDDDEEKADCRLAVKHTGTTICSIRVSSAERTKLLEVRSCAKKVAERLHLWTLEDITDEQRATQLLRDVEAMFNAYHHKF